MKILKYYICCVVTVILFFGCTTQKYQPATTALEGGREFIDGCLKGDFEKAAAYMIDDEKNRSELLKLKRDYEGKSEVQKHDFATASIIINEDAVINDTIHIINYKNSYDQFARKIKMIQRNGNWLADFKYTFNGNL